PQLDSHPFPTRRSSDLSSVSSCSPLRADLDFWNGNHELAAPLANVRHLLHDFGFDVPREDQDVIWAGVTNHVGMPDRDMRSRQEDRKSTRLNSSHVKIS